MTPLLRPRPYGSRLRSRSVRMVLVCLGVALLGVGVSASRVAVAQSDEQRLDAARAELAALREQLREAEATAQAADGELEDAERLLADVEAVVNEVATAVDGQQAAVSQAEQRLAHLRDERDVLVDAFHRRATRMFKLGPTQTLDLVLSGEDATAAMARSAYLRMLMEGDQVDLEILEAAEVSIAAEQQRADAEQQRLESLLAEQTEIFAEAEELRESQALAAANARDRVRLLKEQQDDLESEQAEIQTLIKRQQAEERQRQAVARQAARASRSPVPSSGAPSSSATSSAGYGWPLCAQVTSEYGPRWGRTHRGIDLGAGSGTPFAATKSGTVIFAGWQGGYGRLVLIDHGDGVVTASAHLSSIAVGVGQSVQRGQTVGRVGSTGNSTGPHLHLEFRVGGRAVNPRQYLIGRPC